MQLICLILVVGRNFMFFSCSVVVFEDIQLHFKDINERFEIRSCFYRILNNNNFFPKSLFHRIQRSFPVCLFVIELIYSKNQRLFKFFGIAGKYFGANFNSLLRIDDHNTCICNFKSRYYSSDKVVGTRSVNYI
ncbi:MAG: hypothetical protein ACD_77C00330G0001 [uncultured bacterium]|nr:MAG: hypothetical protein ACD_77C00330G0001 [uncultured bacterium]